MDQYIDYSGQIGCQKGDEDFMHSNGLRAANLDQPNVTDTTQQRAKPAYYNTNLQQSISCDIKPRLTKEQHDILEAHFQKQHKPNTNTKKRVAEGLGVSLDKVNNWFQNRRAKSKQEVKKQQGTINLFQAHNAPGQYSVGSGSDSDSSPSYSSPEYLAMMQHWLPEQQLGNGLGIDGMQPFQQQDTIGGLPSNLGNDQFLDYSMGQHLGEEAFSRSDEMNRRTMTQEQFDAMARGEGMMSGPNVFGNLQGELDSDPSVWNAVFPGMQGNDIKQQEAFAFPNSIGAPMSSYDSTVPSTISEQSMSAFPSSTQMQSRANFSASSSEWSDSRSSSICVSQPGESMLSAAQKQATATTSQWQPGQSVPVDFNALNEEFRQAALARERQQHAQEQPLTWPDDESYGRKDSQATHMLAQGLSNFGIHTPQPSQPATFKSPAPPANIAARRQRRPAPIGLGAMRSQSYSGAVPPVGSPAQQSNSASNQQVRRIRSSNMINGNGGVAHGRIMKAASAQRSPLSWSFADALNSPRHVSAQGNLAPPTPMTPNENHAQEQGSQFQSRQASSGHATRHPSINETDIEHQQPYQPSMSVPPQKFSSPPHTPSFYQHQFALSNAGHNAVLENTPPQSAPASQMSFPSQFYAQPQQQQSQPHLQQQPAQIQPQHQHSFSHAYAHPQMQVQTQMPMPAAQQPQQNIPAAASSQPSNQQTVTFAPTQHAPVTSGPPPGVPLQFANGVPMVDDEGNISMQFPRPMQFIPEQHQPPPQAQQLHTPPQHSYSYTNSATGSPNLQITAQLPKQSQQPAQDFFVHEYNPPAELKRAATPRKMVDNGPKNYTFANTSAEHWEKQAKKAEAKAASVTTASNSPAISSTSAS